MGSNTSKAILGLAASITLLVLLPFIFSRYYLDLSIVFLINLILAVSFRLITTTGDFSLAHVPLMGMGAYAGALISKNLGLPFLLTLPLAGLVSTLVGLMMLYPLIRMKEFAFFIGSYAIGEALRLSWIRLSIFGGHRGISNISSPTISIPGLFTADFSGVVPYYFLTLAVTIVCLLCMYLLDRSRITEIFKAIHAEPALVKSVGVNITGYRILAFEVGTFFAGISGVLVAHHLGHIDPHQFELTTGLYLLIWIVVGGYATFWGPIIGVTFFAVFGEWMRVFGAWMPLVYGCILVVALLFLPDGLESLPSRLSFIIKGKGPTQNPEGAINTK
jgi:branched-chain amino acid transport system permease protein